MAIFNFEDQVIYRSYDESSSITYELETTKGNYASLKSIVLSCKDDAITISLGREYTPKIKDMIRKAYMNLPSEEFVDLFTRLSIEEIDRLATRTTAYLGGDRKEDYTAFVDDFGNLLVVTNYVYHYYHGSSTLYKEPAGSSKFGLELRRFCKALFKDVDDYQKFLRTLNSDSLEKYFEASYVPKTSK